VAKRIHYERECWRGLAAARVVEVIAWTRWTPVRENTHKSTFLNGCFHQIFRQIPKSKSLKCCVPYHRHGIEHGLSLDTDFEFTAALPDRPPRRLGDG
jgi:hypothetical protein